MLESLRESSAPGTLLVLVCCEVRLGRDSRESVHGPGLAVDRCVVLAILNFLRFKSDRKPSCWIIRLKHRIHPELNRFLVFKSHCERMLQWVHWCPRHLNVHLLLVCNCIQLAKAHRFSRSGAGSCGKCVCRIDLPELLKRYLGWSWVFKVVGRMRDEALVVLMELVCRGKRVLSALGLVLKGIFPVWNCDWVRFSFCVLWLCNVNFLRIDIIALQFVIFVFVLRSWPWHTKLSCWLLTCLDPWLGRLFGSYFVKDFL